MIDITKPRYERIGECGRCGECCANEECEYLKIENKIYTCMIYDDPNRPEKCKIFPANPPIVFKKCKYKFYDKWENITLKAGEI